LTWKIGSYTMSASYLHTARTFFSKEKIIMGIDSETEEASFLEFRRKVRSAEVLSSAMERLLRSLQFSGRVSVVVQNGRVLKSGYEEGYFRQPEAG
jgi:hypothetical protein